ncbi:hypothetical protein M408DRAFT_170462 [Serendipita vermifera MAFF 305830]|uniref:Uncharacterized protein n=1 Tax=Serendipita vermifera MAFF 305830 TaxID=933852 RepID=A0A0C2WLJ2_SERVB|nr:hypothetical protein M408DRAFT_170462 [Serendipita vermifera MAFF 305830]
MSGFALYAPNRSIFMLTTYQAIDVDETAPKYARHSITSQFVNNATFEIISLSLRSDYECRHKAHSPLSPTTPFQPLPCSTLACHTRRLWITHICPAGFGSSFLRRALNHAHAQKARPY